MRSKKRGTKKRIRNNTKTRRKQRNRARIQNEEKSKRIETTIRRLQVRNPLRERLSRRTGEKKASRRSPQRGKRPRKKQILGGKKVTVRRGKKQRGRKPH